MDELPDLTSDADVDALMARLRARLEPPPQASSLDEAAPRESAQAFDELVAAHEGLAASMVRAMEMIVGTLEELGLESQPAVAAAPARPRRKTVAPRRPAAPARRRRTRR